MTKYLALLVGALGVVGAGWLFSERMLFAMGWTDMGADGPAIVQELRDDLANGLTGIRPTVAPCMKQQVQVDMSVQLQGYVPSGDQLLMQLTLSSPEVMANSIYLGPPRAAVDIGSVPLCLDSADPLTEDDDASFAYLTVTYFDLERQSFQAFTSEDASPIFAWQDVNVDLLEIAEESPSGGTTRLRLAPSLQAGIPN